MYIASSEFIQLNIELSQKAVKLKLIPCTRRNALIVRSREKQHERGKDTGNPSVRQAKSLNGGDPRPRTFRGEQIPWKLSQHPRARACICRACLTRRDYFHVARCMVKNYRRRVIATIPQYAHARVCVCVWWINLAGRVIAGSEGDTDRLAQRDSMLHQLCDISSCFTRSTKVSNFFTLQMNFIVRYTSIVV